MSLPEPRKKPGAPQASWNPSKRRPPVTSRSSTKKKPMEKSKTSKSQLNKADDRTRSPNCTARAPSCWVMKNTTSWLSTKTNARAVAQPPRIHAHLHDASSVGSRISAASEQPSATMVGVVGFLFCGECCLIEAQVDRRGTYLKSF